MPTCTFEYKGSGGTVKEDLEAEDATVELFSELFSLEPESIRLLGGGKVIRQKNGVFEGLISGKTYKVMGTYFDSSVETKTTSTFTCEGKKPKEVNVEAVDDLAEKLAEMFSLELETIKLAGDGDLFKQDKRGIFHGIRNGTTYEVLGSMKKLQVSLTLPAKDLEIVGREVVNDTRMLLEKGKVLVRAPGVATLVRGVCLLARALPRDVSLMTEDKPKFQYLRRPNSLSACLYQVKAAICDLTQLSNEKMLSISLALSNIPEDYRSTEQVLRNACQGDMEGADETLQNVKRNLQGTAKNCRKWANEVKDEANKVTKVISELQEAVIAAQTGESNQLEKTKLKLQKLRTEQAQKEEERKELEEELAKKKEVAEEAARLYKEKLDSCGGKGTMFLLGLGDAVNGLIGGTVDAVKNVASTPVELLKIVGEHAKERAYKTFDDSKTKAGKAMREAAVAVLAGCIEQTMDRLTAETLSTNDCEEIIGSFTVALEMIGTPDDKIAIAFTQQVKKAIGSLKEIGNQQGNPFGTKAKDHRVIGKELGMAVENYRKAMELIESKKEKKYMKKAEEARLNTAREQTKQGLLANAQEAMKSAQEEKRRADAERNEASRNMRETTRAINDIVCQLGTLDFKKVDLEKVAEYLQNAVELIERLEGDFRGMADFFEAFAALIRLKFSANITAFLQCIFHVAQESIEEGNEEADEPDAEVSDPQFTKVKSVSLIMQNVATINKSMLRSIGLAMQIEKVAKVYLEISDKYVMPAISGQQKTFALTKEEAQQELENIRADLDQTNRTVENLVEERMGIQAQHSSITRALEDRQRLAIE